MNINETLIDRTASALHRYGVSPSDLRQVLIDEVDFGERQGRAIDFIKGVLADHGKGRLWAYVTRLAEVESGIKQLNPRQRDHVVHAVRVFVLGVYLNEFFLGRNAVDPLQWKIAGLTHDVGYPLQIAARVGSPFCDELNSISKDLGIDIPPVEYQVPRILGLDRLAGWRSGLQLIQDQLDRWRVGIHAREVYAERTGRNKVCHGVVSALTVLKVIDMSYAKENSRRKGRDLNVGDVDWDRAWFDDHVVPACTAIFLHNLEARRLAGTPVRADQAPVAFLLRLADTLQEWERPSEREPHGHSPDLFDIDVSGDTLVFTADIAKGIRRDLKVALDHTLTDHNVRIRARPKHA